MGNELPPLPKIDYEVSIANLVEVNRDRLINHGGLENMPFPRFAQMQSLCGKEYGPNENVEEAKASDLTNFAAENKLVIPDDLQHLIRAKESNVTDVDKQKDSSDKEKSKPEKFITDNNQEEFATKNDPNNGINLKAERVVQKLPTLHPEIMARVVRLETKPAIIKPTVETFKQVTKGSDTEFAENKHAATISPNVADGKADLVASLEIITHESKRDNYTVMMPASEVLINQPNLEAAAVMPEDELVEDLDLIYGEFTYVPLVESDIETIVGNIEQNTLLLEATSNELVETEFSEMTEQFELHEEFEKTPAVTMAEFMLQVLPAVTQEVYERVQEMEPEAAAEVAAQIETISIVADRLHELVVQGKTDGEEAKQIEAYLKREYEQLLVAVGIESTEEILKEFIRYIYSAEYQIREDINLKELEIIDEGTHEKKLFDEQGVFSRAHAASLDLSRRLDKSIGQLVVNYFSS